MLQKALSCVFVLQMHNKLFSGAHTTLLGNRDLSVGKVAWCIGREKFRAFCGGSLPCHHLERPIVGNICCFDLPAIYSLFSDNRIATFLWRTPLLTVRPQNLGALIPPPHLRVNVWPRLDQSMYAPPPPRDDHVTQTFFCCGKEEPQGRCTLRM